MYKSSLTQFIIEIWLDGSLHEPLTSSFATFRIINTTNSCWPIFYLSFHIDNQVIIEEDIYGSKEITVKVWYTTENGEKKGEPMIYDLIYLESNLDLPDKNEDNGTIDDMDEVRRRYVGIQCLAKQASLVMTQFVNKLYEEETDLRPIDIVYDILDSRNIEYRIFEDGVNEETIQQLIIPPTTIKNAVDYINEKFGIYEGPMFRYVNYSGQFLLWDLKQQYELYKDAGFFVEHKLPVYTRSKTLYKEVNDMVAESPDQFLTYDNFQTLHFANALVMKYGYQDIFITHPHEDIFHMLKSNTDDIVTDYGIWHDNDEMKYYSDLKNRKLYFHDMKGFEVGSGYSGVYDDHILTSQISDCFKETSLIRFTMYRNVKIPLAEKVGEVVYFQPYSLHEFWPGSNYAGAYLIRDSDIVFSKHNRGLPEDNVVCTATITAFRTVQSMD